jgi:hypothetical protein
MQRGFAQVTAAALLFLSLAGCHAAMHENTTSSFSPSAIAWPLRFSQHNFTVATYSTYGVRAVYNNRLAKEDDPDKLQIASASVPGYPDNLSAGWLGIDNFPPPVDVSWRSADGVPHQAQVDIGEIFKDQRILHKVPREEIAENGTIGTPGIIVEVNDRTINVYMRAYISTKSEQIPGNKYSHHRDDLILAWTRTY